MFTLPLKCRADYDTKVLPIVAILKVVSVQGAQVESGPRVTLRLWMGLDLTRSACVLLLEEFVRDLNLTLVLTLVLFACCVASGYRKATSYGILTER